MNYVPALDGVRAIAVLTVIVFHTFYDRFPGGYIGVDLFFVLSGYLITSNLLAEWENCGRIDMPRFWLRRVRRLAPGLYVFLACLAFAALFTKIRNDVLEAIGFAATYTMNWARAFELGPDTVLAHTWSLAIEQQFYLIWPIVLSALLAKAGRRGAPLAILALILAVLGWRIALEAMHAPGTRIYNGFDTRADALLIGCLLAFLPNLPRTWSPWLFWSASLVGYLFVLFGNNGQWSLIWGFTAFAAVAAIWIAAAASAVTGQFAHTLLTLEPLVAIGRDLLRHVSLALSHPARPEVPGFAKRSDNQPRTAAYDQRGRCLVPLDRAPVSDQRKPFDRPIRASSRTCRLHSLLDVILRRLSVRGLDAILVLAANREESLAAAWKEASVEQFRRNSMAAGTNASRLEKLDCPTSGVKKLKTQVRRQRLHSSLET